MERDQRITGSFRGQSSNHQAPTGFDVSNPWKVRSQLLAHISSSEILTQNKDREPDLLDSKIATSFPLRSMSAPLLFCDHISAAISLETLYHIIFHACVLS
jgi:hypothetical protein